MPEIIITDGHLTIRKMDQFPDDHHIMARWLTDTRVLEFYEGRDHPFTLDMVVEDFDPETLRAEEVTPCILEDRDRPVGYLQFYPVEDDGMQEYQFEGEGVVFGLDLFIGEPEYWNRGLGTQFIRLLLRYLFEDRQADWAILDPHVDNARAIHVYEKCGFRKLKVLEKHEWHEGQYVDCWLMGVRAADWAITNTSGRSPSPE